MKPIVRRLESARAYLGEGIWEPSPAGLSRPRALLRRLLRVSVLVAKGFKDNRCRLHASALTYTTLISLVPFLAFAFAVAKGLEVQKWLEAPGGPIDRLAVGGDVARELIAYIDRTDVRTLGALGLVTLIWTVIQVLATIENTFNEIWGVQKPRTLFRKFSDYLSVVVVCPVLLAAAMMMTAVLKSSAAVAWLHAVPWLGDGVEVLFRLLPFVAMWAAFTGFYVFMPNTRVPFLAALGGGIVAGTAWQVGQWVYVSGNVMLAKYSAIYASFASFPVFLVWLHVSWLIALFGAEVAFALQHEKTYQREARTGSVSPAERERMALELARGVAERFRKGHPAWTVDQAADALDLPVRIVAELADRLATAGILLAVPGPAMAYAPARAPDTVTLKQVLDAVRHGGEKGSRASGPAADAMTEAEEALEGSLGSVTLDDFARRGVRTGRKG